LNRGKRLKAPLFVTEAAFVPVTSRQVAGAPPAGMKPHAMAAGPVFIIRTFMAGSADLHIHHGLPLQYFLVIGAVTFLTADTCPGMGADLPLMYRSRSFLAMTLNAVVSI
jgi:hypothetical protein